MSEHETSGMGSVINPPPLPPDAERIAAALAEMNPLLKEYKPEGWVDFREGYNRGARFGVFVDMKSYDADRFRMKAVFDNREDAEAAATALRCVGSIAVESVDGNTLVSVLFTVDRTANIPNPS